MSECNGDCKSCPIQCGRSTLDALAKARIKENQQQGKDENKMAENVLSCSSGEKEKITAHAAWIESTKRALLILGVVVVAILAVTYFVTENIKNKIAETELRHEKALTKLQTETTIRIENLEAEVAELKGDCKSAERAYQNARATLSRYRRK